MIRQKAYTTKGNNKSAEQDFENTVFEDNLNTNDSMNQNKNINNENNSDDNLESFKNNIETTSEKFLPQRSKDEENKANAIEAEKLIREVARQQELTFTAAGYAVSDLYQKGAHLKTVANRSTFVNGIQVTKQNLNQAMIRLNIKATHRSLARSIRDAILLSSIARDIPGHLAKQFKEHVAINGIQLDEATIAKYSYYCTDFHIDNPEAPSEVTKFLLTRTRTKKHNSK